jgi:hypothetical protein
MRNLLLITFIITITGIFGQELRAQKVNLRYCPYNYSRNNGNGQAVSTFASNITPESIYFQTALTSGNQGNFHFTWDNPVIYPPVVNRTWVTSNEGITTQNWFFGQTNQGSPFNPPSVPNGNTATYTFYRENLPPSGYITFEFIDPVDGQPTAVCTYQLFNGGSSSGGLVSGPVSSGSDGGLESEGSLADKIALRHFERQTHLQPEFDNPTEDKSFEKNRRQARIAADDLANFIPISPFVNSRSFISTPTDLPQITNAKKVLAVDYFVGKYRTAALLATYTENEVYNHTKTICDRLNGGKILEIKPIQISGGNFILTKILQPTLIVEYAICFSLADNGTHYMSESRWGIDEFAKGKNYLNFQIWASSTTDAEALVTQILKMANKPIHFSSQKPSIPTSFVESGRYTRGRLILNIRSVAPTKVVLNGKLKRTETTQYSENWAFEQTLDQSLQVVEIPVNQMFDSGITITDMTTNTHDVLYLADSPWGIDTPTQNAHLQVFEVTENKEADTPKNGYLLERNAHLKAEVKSYVSLFKMLRPSAQPLDMSDFEGVQFEASGKGIVEVVLMKKSIANFEEQFRFEVKLNANTRSISIPYSDFYSIRHKVLNVKDITAVVFSFRGNDRDFRTVELSISNLHFVKSINSNSIEKTSDINISVYPNPTTSEAKMIINLFNDAITKIGVYDLNGRLFWTKEIQCYQGNNEILLPINDLQTGEYMCTFQAGNLRLSKKMMVIR